MTLTEKIVFALICDACSAHWDGSTRQPNAATRSEVVVAARREGWTHLADMRDICPGCVPLVEAGA